MFYLKENLLLPKNLLGSTNLFSKYIVYLVFMHWVFIHNNIIIMYTVLYFIIYNFVLYNSF